MRIPSPKLLQIADPLGAIRGKFEVGVSTHEKRAVETLIMSMLRLHTKSINLLAGKDNKTKIIKSLKKEKIIFHRVEYTQPLKRCYSETEENHEIHVRIFFEPGTSQMRV